MILKESHLRRPRKKDLVDDKSDGSLNLGNSDDETQM